MGNDEAEAHKARGNALVQEGKYKEALAAYSEAIAVDATDPKYFSNRANANNQLGQFDEAIKDAKKALELEPSFVKAYSHMGRSYFLKKQYARALEVFGNGLAHEPDHAGLKEWLAHAKNADEARRGVGSTSASSANASAPSAQQPSASAAGGAGDYAGPWEAAFGDSARRSESLRALLRAAAVLSFFLYIVPTGSEGAYRRALYCSLAACLWTVGSVVARLGKPRMDPEYIQQLMQHPELFLAMTSGILLTSRPYPLAAVSIGVTHAHAFARWLTGTLRARPTLLGAVGAPVDRLFGLLVGEAWKGASTATKWNIAGTKCAEWSANLDVMVAVFGVFELLTPRRNLIFIVFYWQSLHARFMLAEVASRTSGTPNALRKAFGHADARFGALTSHRLCPSAVRWVYSKVRGFIASQGDLDAQQQRSQSSSGMFSGLAQRCVVS